MKVCVISTPIFPVGSVGLQGYGGLEMVAWQRARGLAQRGHEVTLIAPDGSELPGGKVIHTGPPGQVSEKQAYSRYWPALPEFDVIIDDSWSKWSYALKNEGKLKAPVLGVCHAPVNTMFTTPPQSFVERPCIVCISKDQAGHCREMYGCEARVAYNGVDTSFYKPLRVPRSDRFLFLARFSSIKGADLAIKACLEAGAGLDLVGDTSITNEPEYYAECLALSHQETPGWDRSKGRQIRVVGPQDRRGCVYWFSQALALLHPNQRFREPFGLAPVEAMACGCPVVAWDNGAMRETIHHEAGWLHDNERDYFTRVRSVYDGEAGRQLWKPVDRSWCVEWAKNFDLDHMLDGYERLMREAVEEGGW